MTKTKKTEKNEKNENPNRKEKRKKRERERRKDKDKGSKNTSRLHNNNNKCTHSHHTHMNFGCMEPIPGNFGPISEWGEVDRTRPRNAAVKITIFDTFQELLWVGYNDVIILTIHRFVSHISFSFFFI